MGNHPKDPLIPPAGASRDELDAELSELSKSILTCKSLDLPDPSTIEDDVLLRYFDGALPDAERAAFERQLLDDDDAKQRLAILGAAFGDAGLSRERPTTSSTANALSRYVFHIAGGLIELLRGHGASQFQPAIAVRGSAQPTAFAVERTYETAHGALSARFELHAERANSAEPALIDLVVHVGAAGTPAEGVRCKLLRDGRPIDSREVDSDGCTFARLGPARYDVELRKGGVEVGRLLFDLRG